MTLKETATIAFSSALAGAGHIKHEIALGDLFNFIDNHVDIELLDREEIDKNLFSILLSYKSTSQLAKQYRLTIAIRDLSLDDTRKISSMGFDVYSADGLRLAG